MEDAQVKPLQLDSSSPISGTIGIIYSIARTFGIGTIVAGFLLYEHFFVLLPSHEEGMKKQIEQCTEAVVQISKELQKVFIKLDEICHLLQEKPEEFNKRNFHENNRS